MSPGDVELLQVVVSWTVTLPAAACLIVMDERRLKGDALDNAWPPQSRDAALFASWNMGLIYLCVCVWLHFVRTRRSLAGVGLGTLWCAVIVAADVGAELGAAATVDWLRL